MAEGEWLTEVRCKSVSGVTVGSVAWSQNRSMSMHRDVSHTFCWTPTVLTKGPKLGKCNPIHREHLTVEMSKKTKGWGDLKEIQGLNLAQSRRVLDGRVVFCSRPLGQATCNSIAFHCAIGVLQQVGAPSQIGAMLGHAHANKLTIKSPWCDTTEHHSEDVAGASAHLRTA